MGENLTELEKLEKRGKSQASVWNNFRDAWSKSHMFTDTLRRGSSLFLLRTKCVSKIQCLIIAEKFERETFQCDTFHIEEYISFLLLGGIIPILIPSRLLISKNHETMETLQSRWEHFLVFIYAALPDKPAPSSSWESTWQWQPCAKCALRVFC